MALGELLSEVRAKVTSTKIHPFESSGQGVRYEANITGEHSGPLSGREVGTGYFLLAPDGTMTGTGYSILTTSTGEIVLIEDRGMSVTPTPAATQPSDHGHLQHHIT